MTRVVTWLLTGQLVVDLVLAALLGFFVWKARVLVDTLAKAAAGTDWKTEKMAEAFTGIGQAIFSAATSIELSATSAAATAVAVQTLTRDLRPVVHGQTDDPPSATIDLSKLIEPDD